MADLATNILSAIAASPRDMGAYRDLMALLREPGMGTHGALLGARSALSRAIGGGWAASAELEWLVGALRDALTLDASTARPSHACGSRGARVSCGCAATSSGSRRTPRLSS